MKVIHVAVAVIEKDGKYLLADRPEGKPMPGWWEMPGGKVEEGESFQEALEREMIEELGIAVKVGELVHMATTVYPGKIGDRANPLVAKLRFYECDIVGGTLLPQEGQHIGWYDARDVVEKFMPVLPGDWTVLLAGGRRFT